MEDIFKLPEFPTQWGEPEEERIKELRTISSQHKALWEQHFRPDVYADKPSWEKALRSRATAARYLDFPPGLGWTVQKLQELVPFYDDRAFDYISKAIEEELRELERQQRVAAVMPTVLEQASFAFAKGLPISDSAYFYEMFPELNPSTPAHRRLQLSSDERRWLEGWLEDLAKVPKDQVVDYFTKRPLAPESWQDALDRIGFAGIKNITPIQIMSSVALSQNVDDIANALTLAYPPQGTEEDPQKSFEQTQEERIHEEMKALGLEITGDWDKDISSLWQKKEELDREAGIPITIDVPEIGAYDAFLVNDTDVYQETSAGRELIGYYDSEKDLFFPLTEDEELRNLNQIPFTIALEDGTELELIYRVEDSTVWLKEYNSIWERIGVHSLQLGSIDKHGDLIPRDPMVSERLVGAAFWTLDKAFLLPRMLGASLMTALKPGSRPPTEHWDYADEWQSLRGEIAKDIYGDKLPRHADHSAWRLWLNLYEKYPNESIEFKERMRAMEEELDTKYGVKRSEVEYLLKGLPPEEYSPDREHAYLFERMTDVYAEVPWWEQMLWQLPFWTFVGVEGLTATAASKVLHTKVATGGVVGGAARVGEIALKPAVGYEWCVGKAFYYSFGQLPKVAHNLSEKVARHKFEHSMGGQRLHTIFPKGSMYYEEVYKVWKLMQKKPPEGQPADFYTNLAKKSFEHLYATDITFRKGVDKFMKWGATQPGSTASDASFTYALIRVANATTGTPPDTATLIGNIFKKATETGTPISAITAATIRDAVPSGVLLEKSANMMEQLKELGWTQKAIDAMMPEEAWANLITGKTPVDIIPLPEALVRTGEPLSLTAYRGIRVDAPPIDEGLVGKATYLSTSPEYAATYGELSTWKVDLKNPLVIQNQQEWDMLSGRIGMIRKEAVAQGKNEDWVQQQVREQLMADGYDGVYIAPDIVEKGAQIAVFDVKSLSEVAPIPSAETATKLTWTLYGAEAPQTIQVMELRSGDWVTFTDPDGNVVTGKVVSSMADGTAFMRQNPDRMGGYTILTTKAKHVSPPSGVVIKNLGTISDTRLVVTHNYGKNYQVVPPATATPQEGVPATPTAPALAPVPSVNIAHRDWLQGQIDSLTAHQSSLQLQKATLQIKMETLPPDKVKYLESMRKDLSTHIADIQAQIEGYKGQLESLARPPEPDKPLAPTRDMGESWIDIPPDTKVNKLLEAGLEHRLAHLLSGQGLREMTAGEAGAVFKSFPELRPSIGTTKSLWDAANPDIQGQIAYQAGIAKTSIGKGFDELTSIQQELIRDAIGKPPKEPVLNMDKASGKDISISDLQQGKARDPKATELNARGDVGNPDRVIDAGDLDPYTEIADRIIREQLFSAYHDNPLSVAYVASARLGSVEEFARQLAKLPHKEDGTIDWDAHVTQAFKEQDFVDAHAWVYNWQPVRDAIQYIDGGKRGMLTEKVYDINEQAIVANMEWQLSKQVDLKKFFEDLGIDRPKWFDHKNKTWFNDTTFKIAENIPEESLFLNTESLLENSEIAKLVEGLSKEKATQLIEFSRGMRFLFHQAWQEANVVRDVQGREPIPLEESYVPHVWKVGVWGKVFGRKLKPDTIAEQPFAPDFVRPISPFNPHAEARLHGIKDPDLQKDLVKLYIDYVGVLGKEIFFTPAVGNAKAHARYLETEKGLPSPARWIEDRIVQQGLLGIPDALTKGVMERIPPTIYNLQGWLNQRLTAAVFGLNPAFSLVVQGSSLANTVLLTSSKKTMQGLFKYLFSKDERLWVEENVPTQVIKQRGRGSLIHQDLGQTLVAAKKMELSPLETVEDKMLFFTMKIEKFLTGASSLAGKYDGIEKGYEGARLVAHASDIAGKSQSRYDPYSMPGAYPEAIRRLFRFQTFHFDALTRMREMTTIKYLKAGSWKEAGMDSKTGKDMYKVRFKKLMEFFAVVTAVNLYGEWLTGRKPWEPSSFLPFAGTMMLPFDITNPWNMPMPVRYIHDLYRGIDAFLEYGRWERLSKWALSWHMPGGVQAARMQDAIIAMIEGQVTKFDEEETPMFEIEPKDWWRAVIFGVWTTESAREYRRRVIEDFPAETHYMLDQMEQKEVELGESIGYTLSNYRTDMLNMVEKYGVPTWQYGIDEREDVVPELWEIIQDVPFYTPLAVYALYTPYIFDEYEKIHYPNDPSRTTRERQQYRRDNPFVDASLIFWERVRTYRSPEAKELLGLLFATFGYDEDGKDRPYMHWTRLPEVPSWVELLDD